MTTKDDQTLKLLRAIQTRLDNPLPPKAYMTTAEASAYTGIGRASFEEWRCEGVGPRFVKLSAKVLYRVADLDAFMAERIVETKR